MSSKVRAIPGVALLVLATVLSVLPGSTAALADTEAPVVDIDYIEIDAKPGMYVTHSDGWVDTYGPALAPIGETRTPAAGHKIIGLAPKPGTTAFWTFASDGTVEAHSNGSGPIQTFGDLSAWNLAAPIIAAAATPSGEGYYMVGADGGIFAFGDARFYGSIPGVLPGVALDAPVVGISASERGYLLIAADGGTFAFGDAQFHGSVPQVLPGVTLDAPVVGVVSQPGGYLMVASDGGIFNFGKPKFYGSLGGTGATGVTAVALTPFGYVMAQSDGTTHAFGDVPLLTLNEPSDPLAESDPDATSSSSSSTSSSSTSSTSTSSTSSSTTSTSTSSTSTSTTSTSSTSTSSTSTSSTSTTAKPTTTTTVPQTGWCNHTDGRLAYPVKITHDECIDLEPAPWSHRWTPFNARKGRTSGLCFVAVSYSGARGHVGPCNPGHLLNGPACSFNGYDSLGDEWYSCDGDRVTDWGPRLEKPADPNVGRCVEEDGTSWGWMTRSQCAERIYLYEPGGTGGGYWEHPKDTGVCVVDFFYSDGPGAPGFPSGPCDMVDLADPACNYARFHVDLGFSEWNCDGDTYQGRFLSRDELEARASTGPGDPALGHCPDDYGGYWGLLTKEQCESRPWGPMWEPID